MAQINVSTGSSFIIDAANTYLFSLPADRAASTILLHLVSDSFSGSITVKARAGSVAAQTDAIDPVAVNYLNIYSNGAVGDQAYANDALTDTSLILVPATGQQIVLDCTSYTSGTFTVYAVPVLGAAA
jgi:hypothetical protein